MKWDVLIVNGVSPQVFTLGLTHFIYDDLAFEPYKKKSSGLRTLETLGSGPARLG